jgi:hypothetical protein
MVAVAVAVAAAMVVAAATIAAAEAMVVAAAMLTTNVRWHQLHNNNKCNPATP